MPAAGGVLACRHARSRGLGPGDWGPGDWGRGRGPLTQRPVQVGEQILGAFQSDRDADHGVAQADSGPSFGAHRTVRGGRRVGDQRLGVAEVVGDVDDTQLVEYLEGALFTLTLRRLELEGHDGAAAGHLTLG